MIRFLIMNLYVNEHRLNPIPLIFQNEDTFAAINVIVLEQEHCSKLELNKGKKSTLPPPKKYPYLDSSHLQKHLNRIINTYVSTWNATHYN